MPPSASAAAAAPVVRVSYAENEDTFHQDQYRELRWRIEKELPKVVGEVLSSEVFRRGLGITPNYEFHWPLHIQIKVIPEDSLYHGLQGTAGWRQTEHQWTHELTINIAAFVQNPREDLHVLLSHELAHIVVADVMGPEPQERIPMWLNEGIAQSVSKEGRSRVREFAASLGWEPSMLIPCALEGPINTFAHGEGNFRCYPEYYVATARIRQIGGPLAIGQLLKALRERQSLKEAFSSATALDYANFQSEVDRYMGEIVSGRKAIP